MDWVNTIRKVGNKGKKLLTTDVSFSFLRQGFLYYWRSEMDIMLQKKSYMNIGSSRHTLPTQPLQHYFNGEQKTKNN